MVVLASFLSEEIKHIFTCTSRYIKNKEPFAVRYEIHELLYVEKKRKKRKKKNKRKEKEKKYSIIEQVGIPRLLQPKPLGTGAESDMRAANNAPMSIFVTLSSAICMSMHVLEANNYTAYMYSCTANHGTCTCFVSCDVMLFDNNDHVFLRSITGFHIPLQCTTQVNTLSFSLVTKLKETLASSSKNSE